MQIKCAAPFDVWRPAVRHLDLVLREVFLLRFGNVMLPGGFNLCNIQYHCCL